MDKFSQGTGAYKVQELVTQHLHNDLSELCIYKISDVLNRPHIDTLRKEIRTVPLSRNCNDMCSFHQSDLLENISNLPTELEKLLKFFKNKVRKTVEELFKITTEEKITATISKYSRGDYLLCHDDLRGNRAVAFVLYLSEGLTSEDGGELRFFDHDQDDDPVSNSYFKEVRPDFNSLILFRVNNVSHHEVHQMFTDKERWTINGWFHSAPNSNLTVKQPETFSKAPIVKFTVYVNPCVPQDSIFSRRVLQNRYIMACKDQLTEDNFAVVIPDCFQPTFYDTCALELKTVDLWEAKGPANHRYYDTIPFKVIGPHIIFGESLLNIGYLVDVLVSPQWLNILSDLTGGWTFVTTEECSIPPACVIEVQRWREGNYSLLSDQDVERIHSTIEVSLFFQVNSKSVGSDVRHDNSGLVVISRNSDIANEYLEQMFKIKLNRHLRVYYKTYKTHTYHVIQVKKKDVVIVKEDKLKKQKWLKRTRAFIQYKINRIREYRRSAEKMVFIPPESNSLVISFGGKNMSKYISYIKKQSALSGPDVSFYAVNVTYFVEPSGEVLQKLLLQA